MSQQELPPTLEQYPGYFPAAKPPFWTRGRVGIAAGDPAKGTGLGTRLIKALAQSHGASIAFCDREPGLAVRFVLPLKKVASAT